MCAMKETDRETCAQRSDDSQTKSVIRAADAYACVGQRWKANKSDPEAVAKKYLIRCGFIG